MAVNLDSYAAEVESGLPNERTRLDRALENQALYDFDGDRYTPHRDAETEFDYQGRQKRTAGLLREAVEVLTEHLYGPGPARSWDDAAGDAFLQRVWTDNLIDGLMQEADKLAHLNDVAAVQVDAGEGDFAGRPIELHLWGADEFHAWPNPDDCKKVAAVVTIDKYDLRTRYKLWSDAEVRVYETARADQTAGGRVATEVSREPNTYGVIPFAFCHYKRPVRGFWTAGIGSFLARSEVNANDRLTRLNEAIHKHLNPIPVAENVAPDWNPHLEPGRFLKLAGKPTMGLSGGYEPGTPPRLWYLQAAIDVAGAWDDLIRYLNQVFEAVRVPLSAVRMDQSGVQSGIAIVAEQAPLLARARQRRALFGYFEQQLAALILACAGNHYRRPGLAASSRSGRLTLAWSEPTIPIPGPDRDESDRNELQLGTSSRLMLIQRRYGCTRDQAIALLRQIAEDRKLEDEIDPEPVPLEGTGGGPGQHPAGGPTPGGADGEGNEGE